jgi:exodeoxyribonuclease V
MSVLSSLSLSEDQVFVLNKISDFLLLSNPERELRIGGLAGTGKTTMIAKYLNENRSSLQSKLSFATFTGKAAERLMHSFKSFGLDIEVMTLHRLIYLTVLDPISQKLRFIEHETLPAFIVIDEASMVSEEYYNLLMDPSKGVKKIIFVGDHGQLPPIVKDNEKPFNLMENPTIKLEQIHRQCAGNPIIELAYAVRNASSVNEVLRLIHQSSIRKVSREGSFEGSLELSNASSWNHVVHIVYKNATRVSINQQFSSLVSTDTEKQPIIVLKNKHVSENVFLANGSRGLITRFHSQKIEEFDILDVDFPFSGKVSYIKAPKSIWNNPKPETFLPNQEWIPMDWAYAITCHKAQGSSWKNVFVWLNDVHRGDLDFLKRWIYTAITRTEQNVYFVI